MVNFIIITHGEFGAYLMEAAEEIVGRQSEGVRVVAISPRLGVEELRRGVARAVAELRSDDGLVVLTDMPGGTPSNIVLPLVKDLPRVAVISGINLYMIISAFNARAARLPLEEAVRKILADAARSIRDIKAVLRAAAVQ